jgi:hypothetical protein
MKGQRGGTACGAVQRLAELAEVCRIAGVDQPDFAATDCQGLTVRTERHRGADYWPAEASRTGTITEPYAAVAGRRGYMGSETFAARMEHHRLDALSGAAQEDDGKAPGRAPRRL